MKTSDKYHKWAQWSQEDQVYLGKCPDLVTEIHGDDPIQLYGDLCEVVENVIEHFDLKVVLFLYRGFDQCKRWRAVNTNSARQKRAALVSFPS